MQLSSRSFGFVVAAVFAAGVGSSNARAAAYTFPSFDIVANDSWQIMSNPGLEQRHTFDVSQVPEGVYNRVTVKLDWSLIDGETASNEAVFGLISSQPADWGYYIFPAYFPTPGYSMEPSTITFVGHLARNYIGGDPLSISARQAASYASAQWSNVSVTVDYAETPTSRVIFTGDTTGGPRFHRPTTVLSPANIPGKGLNVPYQVTPITVDAPGTYIFSSYTDLPYDGFLLLYKDVFNPLDPMNTSQLLETDGDDSVYTSSTLFYTLFPGTTYFLVQTGNYDDDFGAYSMFVTGPGTVTVVPEPAMLAGVMAAPALLFARRRRTR